MRQIILAQQIQMHTADWTGFKSFEHAVAQTVSCLQQSDGSIRHCVCMCVWGAGCRYSRLRHQEKTLYCLKKLSIKKPPVVWTVEAAVSELTSEPLSSCMPLSLLACLTACLSACLSLFQLSYLSDCLSSISSGDVHRQRAGT